jgi:hypothetical protein
MEDSCSNAAKPKQDPELLNMVVRLDETLSSYYHLVNRVCNMKERLKLEPEKACEGKDSLEPSDILTRFQYGLDRFDSINNELALKIEELERLI